MTFILAIGRKSARWTELILPQFQREPWVAISIETTTLGFHTLPNYENIEDGTPACVLIDQSCAAASNFIGVNRIDQSVRLLSHLGGLLIPRQDQATSQKARRYAKPYEFVPSPGPHKRAFYLFATPRGSLGSLREHIESILPDPDLITVITGTEGDPLIGSSTMTHTVSLFTTTVESFEAAERNVEAIRKVNPNNPAVALIEI